MINQYVTDLASSMGISLTHISITHGKSYAVKSEHLLLLSARQKLVSVLVNQFDLDSLQSRTCCKGLETKIRSALIRLQTMFNPTSKIPREGLILSEKEKDKRSETSTISFGKQMDSLKKKYDGTKS